MLYYIRHYHYVKPHELSLFELNDASRLYIHHLEIIESLRLLGPHDLRDEKQHH